MFPTISIGPAAVQAPGLILLVGLFLGITLAEKWAVKFRGNPNFIYNLVLWIMIGGVLGARLSYVLQYPAIFLESPLSILSLNYALLDPWGGLLTGLLIGYYYLQKQGEPLWQTLDSLTPMLALLLAAWHFSNLASGNAFGYPTTLPWGIELWNEIRHPVQLYEMAGALVILGVLFWYVRSSRNMRPGAIFLAFTASTAAVRLFFEFFRGGSTVLASTSIRLPQLAAWLLMAAALWLLQRRTSQPE